MAAPMYQLYKYHSHYFDKDTAAKGTNHCVTITTVIFSHVKITCYFICEDMKFSRGRFPGISLVLI